MSNSQNSCLGKTNDLHLAPIGTKNKSSQWQKNNNATNTESLIHDQGDFILTVRWH